MHAEIILRVKHSVGSSGTRNYLIIHDQSTLQAPRHICYPQPAEDCMVNLSEDSNFLAIQAMQITIVPKDIQLPLRIYAERA